MYLSPWWYFRKLRTIFLSLSLSYLSRWWYLSKLRTIFLSLSLSLFLSFSISISHAHSITVLELPFDVPNPGEVQPPAHDPALYPSLQRLVLFELHVRGRQHLLPPGPKESTHSNSPGIYYISRRLN